ncbi:DUF6383 domain-containing protein [Parabacteroides distasonis]|uniref:DUF6383 domain-containing protein n=1 Tax=Parabacteroides distasonis TaxID=823 RepID=UPI00232C4045|nr:DUF6383 domain-containing protein [Parabacteroides distasonis]MDB9032323.1 DUF6383 domain-containing protein [Parabacteroides distasonis]MDB9077757.1 DUF6383 domain-containing protein [Parabacteroides distasonis]
MNKKITTLLASAMLATAFSAGAVKVGDQVLLKGGSAYLSVATQTTTAAQFGQVGTVSTLSSLDNLNPATWKISAMKTSLGKTIYSLENKATGLPLSFDPALAVKTAPATSSVLTLGGSANEWIVENGALVSYFKSDSVVYIAQNGSSFYLAKDKASNSSHAGALALDINVNDFPASVPLDKTALNTLLKSVSKEGSFGLTMTPTVSTGEANHLTDTKLEAETGVQNGYVKLYTGKKVDDKKQYVVVDTAYYTGTESDKFVKFAYDEMDAKGRDKGSYEFKFTYDAKNDKLLVQVYNVAYQIIKKDGTTDDQYKAELAKVNGAKWPASDVTPTSALNTSLVDVYTAGTGQYVYVPDLAGKRVLTVRYNQTPSISDQNVTIKIGTNFSGLKPTTLADGVYLIKYKTTGGNTKRGQNGLYALANLAGEFGWAEQAVNQEFKHMPAAQWAIVKNGTSSTAPVTVKNREFPELSESAVALNNKTVQLYAVDGSDDVFFYNGTVADTLSVTKVEDSLAKDLKLGYRYVSEDSAKVQTYVFNYLHGLALDKYLNVDESAVRVDENGEKANFRLRIVAKDDHYGVGDSLVRNVYYIEKNGGYLTYSESSKKYEIGSTPQPFFLKENNCIDGKHYYALVEANIRYYNVNAANAFYEPKYAGLKNTDQVEVNGAKVIVPTLTVNSSSPLFDKDGKYLVEDNSNIEKAYAYKANSTTGIIELAEISFTNGLNSSYYNSNAAQNGKKVSVDDNSLNLTQGSTDDKFENGLNREIRTSAFAVVTDDSPLYRRFNNTALGESNTDACDSLAFVESVRGEYLMDEWNKNLQDKVVNYAGIWNQGKADGKLFFHIDTAWVNRGAGNIKPQYLISTAHVDVPGTPGVPCTYAHNHYDNNGKLVDAAHCGHATPANAGYHYGKYLVNFSDSAQIVIDRKASANPYMLSTSGSVNSAYTRVGFVEAIHMGDSLYVLTNGFEKMAPADLDTAAIIANYKKAGLERFIVNLAGDNHKNVTWSFRYVNPDKAGNVAEEGNDNSFLIESNVYAANETYRTVKGDKDRAIAPIDAAAWLKMHNGCLVLTDKAATFSSTKTGGDGALVFNVQRMTEEDQFVTSNDEIATEGISVVAGNGTVTVQGAAGKSVAITNILGKVIAETVLTSDNATISVPAGIVAVAVDGEEAVKAIVK